MSIEMRLAKFINLNVEAILVEWESFARSIWPKASLADPEELRNSAKEILRAVVADMASDQTPEDQSHKSHGHGADATASGRLNDASEVHGTARVGSGLALPQVVAEYRALRASVLRLWQDSLPTPDLHDITDITRFNEAIDQSLTRAIASFNKRLDASRNMFLAILGHDLRNPLAAITLCAKIARGERSITREMAEQLSQIISSARAVTELVTDLIDFTSSTMGVRLPISTGPVDLNSLCPNIIGELRAANLGREIKLTSKGSLEGQWDAHRLRQVFANLLGNALQHGSPGDPVTFAIDGSISDCVMMTIHNTGAPIPPDVLPMIFDPLVRGRVSVHERRAPGSIGLGLYIAKEIVAAHGGTISLSSSASAGTTATVRLPR